MKICSLCYKEKPTSEFYVRKRRGEKDFHPWCKDCTKKDRKKKYREGEGKEKARKYRKTPRGAKIHKRARNKYEASKKGKKTRRRYKRQVKSQRGSRIKRTRLEKRIQVAARNAVGSAVRYSRMPPAKDFACIVCKGNAQEYHHHNGYAQECWLDVVPICIKCHRNLDIKIHQSV